MQRKLIMFILALSLSAACREGDCTKDVAPDLGTDLIKDAGPDLAPEIIAEVEQDVHSDVPAGEPVVLLSGGQTSHVVFLGKDASPSEKTAAQELLELFEQATGVALELVDEVPGDDTPMIVLGRNAVAQGLGVDPTDEELGEQGFVIRSVPPHLVIAGTAAAGTMYGIHRFLEEFVGVRWYAPGVTHVPSVTDMTVPPTDRLVKPAFLWRQTSWNWPGKDAAFVAHQGGNGGDGTDEYEYGVQHSHDGRAHSYFWYVHPDDYFDEHPEYFSEIGGVRIKEETQLCLTNPDVLDIVTEKMLQRMADKPNDRQHNFSQQDHYNYCTCDACSAMNEKYKTLGGTQFWFVNELAKRTSEVHPDKLIGTLAYMYTEEPPEGLEMHANTAVWLCHMFPSCDSHPIDECPLDAEYKRRAEEWSEIADQLYIWHYSTDFMHYYNPFPNFRAMAADMVLYRDLGVEGIYLQGMGHSGGGGEFSLLRPWYGMKLLWDPDQDPLLLRRDFLQGYYGQAWEPIEQYIEMLHDKVEDENIHMHLYTNPGQGYLPDSLLDEAEALFDDAQGLVQDDPELLDRVQVARLPLVYARFFPRNGYEIKNGVLNGLGEFASAQQVMWFLDMLSSHGFTTIREVAGDPDTIPLMFSVFAAPVPLKVIENEHLRVEIAPPMAGRALRIIHKSSGKNITAYNVPQNLYFPYAGGLEDRVGELFRYYGWVEPASVAEHTDSSITIALTTVDGFPLTRKLELDPDSPVVHVTSTVTNPNPTPEQVRLRSHLELNLGDLYETRIKFTSLSGTPVDKDISDIIANLREGEHFYDQSAPDSSWQFTGTNGLTVIQTFDNSEIDFTWAYSFPDSLNELELELWSPRTTLEPGQSLSLHHSLSIF